MKLNFLIDEPKGAGNIPAGNFRTRFIDLSQVASIVNRRFYRQGLNWAVANFQIQTDKTCGVVIQKLPNTWVMANAWEKGFRAWQKMNNQALQETPSVKPKFLDFKIYADEYHLADGFDQNLLPQTLVYDSSAQNLTRTTATPGEWISSKIMVPFGPSSPGNTTELEIMAVGTNYAGSTKPIVSLIEGYAASRGLPNTLDPNTPADADDASGSTPENWLSAIFNEGTDQTTEVIQDLLADNNIAPYPFENDGVSTDTQYPGGANQMSGLELHASHAVTGTTIGSRTNLPGGNFPCGLIAITVANADDTAISVGLEITLVPGTHRGYLCEPMTDM